MQCSIKRYNVPWSQPFTLESPLHPGVTPSPWIHLFNTFSQFFNRNVQNNVGLRFIENLKFYIVDFLLHLYLQHFQLWGPTSRWLQHISLWCIEHNSSRTYENNFWKFPQNLFIKFAKWETLIELDWFHEKCIKHFKTPKLAKRSEKKGLICFFILLIFYPFNQKNWLKKKKFKMRNKKPPKDPMKILGNLYSGFDSYPVKVV